MEIIKNLKRLGMTKWRIAKETNVSWNTVNQWEKGTFKPREDKMKILIQLEKDKS